MQENFLVDINPDIELPSYTLVLHKPNSEPIAELFNITDLQVKKYFVDIDEINFNIPFYITINDGSNIENPLFNQVHNGMIIRLNDVQDFTVVKNEIKSDNTTGETVKSVMCYSLEYTLSNKRINGYEGVSRKIYDHTNAKDENGLEIGFLNFIESRCSWKVNYVNSNLLTKFRSLSFSKATFLQAMVEAQKTFGAVFQYDTINKEINVYEISQLGKSEGFYISDKNYLKDLNQTIDHNEVVTRLYLYGKNNVSVQSVNITGQPYVQNISFFKNTNFMSQELIDALNDYEDYIATKEGIFSGYLVELNTYNDNMSTKRIELATLITELKVIESNLDVAISSGQSTTALKSQQSAKINEINNKQLEIENILTQINTVNSNINNLSVDISLNSHLTEELARELDPFIREDEYSDTNYTEDNIQELFDEGKKILTKVSYPSLKFDISIEDFLSLVEGQHSWNKLVLGNFIMLESEEIGFSYEVRLVAYTHNPNDNKLNLTFSNRDSVDDANIYLKDLLESVTTTASTVDFNRYKWDKGEQANSVISEYINNNLNLALQQISKADGQKPMIDERGIWLIKENPDGSIENGQMRLIHNCLAITNDNWNTIEVAISAENGINANLLRGKIGQFAELDAGQITVGSEEQALLDYISEQNQAITVHQILLDNENQSIVTDHTGKITTETTVQSNIDVYRGITKVDGIIGTPILKDKDGNAITYGIITKTDPTSTTSGSIAWTIPTNTNISSDSGYIEIPLTIETKEYTKKLFWSKAKEGQKGADGNDGYTPVKNVDYFDGQDGQDGVSKYLWVRYSQNADGTGFTTDPTNALYIGTAVTTDNVAPINKSLYQWLLVKGEDGVAGESGTDGQTSYLHIRYSDDGGATFTANNGETVGAWIGTYVDFIQADSTNVADYTWNKVKGEDGAQGQDGVAGTDAKVVIITPSHSSFISESTGTDINTYVYTPTTLTLAPQFQNCLYSKWQYSLNGTSWVDVVSGQNGLTITGSILSIASNSALYSSAQTQIIFKVLTDEVNVFDLITIARLYNPVKLAGEVGNSLKQGQDYNGIVINTSNGFVATRGDNKAKTIVNATEGIKIQGFINDQWQDNFYVDTNGFIRAKNIIIEGLESGGNKVFNAQPTPPYKLNDLWKVTGVAGVDFRICTTARASGSYVASDWTNVTDSKNYVDLIKNLNTGTSITGGITTIDRTKVRVEHPNGQYSEMRADGFVRQWGNGEAQYLNDIDVQIFQEYGTFYGMSPPDFTHTVYLPTSFRGRNNVKIIPFPIYFGWNLDGSPRTLDIICEVQTTLSGDVKDLNASPPWVNIRAFSMEGYYRSGKYERESYGIDWAILIIGA